MGARVIAAADEPEVDGTPKMTDCVAEFAGTAIVLVLGLSAATLILSPHSPLHGWRLDPGVRRVLAGLCFASVAACVVYSPLGKRSGGHLNPAVTLGFLLLRKISIRGAAAYVTCQALGAVAGAALAALIWGGWLRAVHFGASAPGRLGPSWAFAAELAGTFALVMVIFNFVNGTRIMRLTPVAAATTIVLCVAVEAPASTTSLNPARSFGPAVVGQIFRDTWIYVLAPSLGALLAAVVFRAVRGRVACAKLVHDDKYECRFRDCAYRSEGHSGVIAAHSRQV